MEDGTTQTVELSPQVQLGVMLRDLIRAGILSGVDERVRTIDWRVEDTEVSKPLDPAKTLLENGVGNNHHLYLKSHPAEPPRDEGGGDPEPVAQVHAPDATLLESKPIRLHIQAGDPDVTRPLRIAATATTTELIEEVAREFGLKLVDPQGRTLVWLLEDKDTGQTLSPGTTLEQGGVLDGHHVSMRQRQDHERFPILPWVLAGLGIAVVVVLGILVWMKFEIPVEVTTSPSEARLVIDGKERGVTPLHMRLRAGTHSIEVSKTPYRPVSKTVDVQRGIPPVDIKLEPLEAGLPDLWLSTNLNGGAVQLDGAPLGQATEGGAFEQKSIPAGDHTLSFNTADGRSFTVGFQWKVGAVPELGNPALPDSTVVAFVTRWNGLVQAHCLAPQNVPASIQVDQNPAVQLSPEGLSVQLSPGAPHQLTFHSGDQQWIVPLGADSEPLLAIFVAGTSSTTPPNTATSGTLTVVTPGVDDAQVLLNNSVRGTTHRGRLVLSSLPPGTYMVSVSKPGYVSDPPVRHTALIAGSAKNLSFNLHPAPLAEASLRIEHAIPDTRVFLDGTEAGAASPSGTFEMNHVPAGNHRVELKHHEYQPEEIEKSFAGGQVTTLTAEQKRLGLVLVNTAPPATRVTYRRADDTQDYESKAGPVWLLPGAYTFIAYWNDVRCSKQAVVPQTPNEAPLVPISLTFHPNCK
jgi:hypothetical protein